MGKCQAFYLQSAVCLYFIFVCLHSSVIGLRAPFLRVGGNTQFEMMNDQFFVYDTSIAAPLGRVPVWVRQLFVYFFLVLFTFSLTFVFLQPYTLLYKMPHKCHGNANNCPSRSHPIWEMPINELDRRDDPEYDERLSGCHLVSSCSNIYSPEAFKRMLNHNFNR